MCARAAAACVLVGAFASALGGCKDRPAAPRDAAPVVVDAAPAADGAAAIVVVDAAPAEAARLEHVGFDLVDNRHAAHRAVAGDLVIDASTVAFARYTRFGVPVRRWALGQDIDGERAAVPTPLATLEVPLTVEQARAGTQLTLRVHASEATMALAVKVNGRPASLDARVELAAGWQTIALAIEAGRLRAGENLIALETSPPVRRRKERRKAPARTAVAWLRIGAARALSDEDPRAAVRFVAPTGSVPGSVPGSVIELAQDASLTYFVPLPEGAHLRAHVAAPCRVEVRARPSADSFAGGTLAADAARVDLSAMGGRVVALQLTARDCPRAVISAPDITVPGPAPAARPAAPAPRLVVLWVMDALRADKLGPFTPGARAQTPNLDELAKASAVFRQYYVQGNESQTSHSSMWAGVYPAVHGVRLAGVGGVSRLPARFPVIATELAEAGFATTATTGNGFVNADNGYARGFATYRNLMRELNGTANGVLYGEKVITAALAAIEPLRAGPAYLFVGTVDTHGPWIARKPWIDVYSPGRYEGPFKDYGTSKELGFRKGSMGCSIIPPPADVERLRAIYDSAISYQDQQLGRFIEQLKSWGVWDETLLMITADHGEEFFEDGRCGHGGSLRDSLVRVPLLVYDPARFPGGTVIEEGVEGVDLLPTVLDAVGRPALPDVQGASLVPLAQGVGRGWARPSYASQYEYAHAMRIGRWKMVVYKSGAAPVRDLQADPLEALDVTAERPVERRLLIDNLGVFLAMRTQWRKASWGVVTNLTAAGAAALDVARAE